MAKRKRLTPPRPAYLQDAMGAEVPTNLETKSGFPMDANSVTITAGKPAPIADVARDASASAALNEVAQELARARNEGLMVQVLPLDQIDVGYLVRDRMGSDDEDMQALIASLKARGQQTPIEVVDLGPEREGRRYGLISGWRRLMALTRLFEQTGEARFGGVQALIRRPGTTGDAYVAMIEENEIRVGLSYFERARIVLRAVEEGVYRNEAAALSALFASASRAKRSKIKSFVPLVAELGGYLGFPAAIGERMGLELAGRMRDAGFATRLKDRLRKGAPDTSEAEQAMLARALRPEKPADKKPSTPSEAVLPESEEIRPGVWLHQGRGEITIRGPGLSEADIAAIRNALGAS
ncbi:MAG: ParB N-terminal domain-containing protein [Roseovarius sp.]|nr:ParB N-terminal domain-containing protein [Roseovarius sp.]